MKASIKQRDIIINIKAAKDILSYILKNFEGFVEIGEYSHSPTYSIVIHNSLTNIPSNAISITDSSVKYNPMITFDSIHSEIWLDDTQNLNRNQQLSFYIISNIYSKVLYNNGYIFLHSSCIDKDGYAVAICGEKNTGKTVNQLTLLEQGYNFITNDMLAIKLYNDELVCHGIPYYIGIRMTKPWICESTNKKYVDLALARNFKFKAQGGELDENKFYISPRKLMEINNTEIRSQSTLVAILNPYYNNATEININKLNILNASKLINSQILNPVHETKPFLADLKTLNPNAMQLSQTKTLNKLLSLPVFNFNSNTNLKSDLQFFVENLYNYQASKNKTTNKSCRFGEYEDKTM